MKDRIKLIRKSENLTQEEFGREIGATRGMVTTYEKGTVPPNATRILICNRFNINPEWLETGEGEMFKKKTAYETLAAFFGDVLNDEPESIRVAILSSLAELDDDGWAMIAEECRIKAEIYEKMKKDSE